MADKKVERSGRERPLTPTQKFNTALSEQGTVNMAEVAHDKGKSALVDKFREREERWRREQAQHDREARAARQSEPDAAETAETTEADDTARSGEPAPRTAGGEGGAT